MDRLIRDLFNKYSKVIYERWTNRRDLRRSTPFTRSPRRQIEAERKKVEQGRDALARRRIPIVGLVSSLIFFAPLPGMQWIVERLIVYCMIIDILPEILLIYIYINFIATVEHSNIWGIWLGRYLRYLLGTHREYYIEGEKEIKGKW